MHAMSDMFTKMKTTLQTELSCAVHARLRFIIPWIAVFSSNAQPLISIGGGSYWAGWAAAGPLLSQEAVTKVHSHNYSSPYSNKHYRYITETFF